MPNILSGYRILWIMVLFDLPVLTPAERKAATAFRNGLLDMGFEMAQYSVYMRFCSSHAQVETMSSAVERILPAGGTVSLLAMTDKQYERIITYRRRTRQPKKHSPSQLQIF